MTGDSDLDAGTRTAALVAAVWKRNLPMLRERLAILDRAASSATAGTFNRGLREEAAATAHKLAGSLGMFGHPDGTRIARDLEQMLDGPDPADAERLTRLVRDLHQDLAL